MARHKVIGPDRHQRGHKRIVSALAGGAGNFIRQQYRLASAVRRIGHRNSGHEFAGIGVLWIFKHRLAWTDFDNLPQIHHRYAMADTLYYRHIVGNK